MKDGKCQFIWFRFGNMSDNIAFGCFSGAASALKDMTLADGDVQISLQIQFYSHILSRIWEFAARN